MGRLRPEVLERLVSRETHTCPACGLAIAGGLVEAENHLVAEHARARDEAREQLVRAKKAAAALAIVQVEEKERASMKHGTQRRGGSPTCGYCRRLKTDHSPTCKRAGRRVTTKAGRARHCRACGKAGHRSNQCSRTQASPNGRPDFLQTIIAQLEADIERRQKALAALKTLIP